LSLPLYYFSVLRYVWGASYKLKERDPITALTTLCVSFWFFGPKDFDLFNAFMGIITKRILIREFIRTGPMDGQALEPHIRKASMSIFQGRIVRAASHSYAPAEAGYLPMDDRKACG
jgi:hypothetical protein